jgi:hypothetical protein
MGEQLLYLTRHYSYACNLWRVHTMRHTDSDIVDQYWHLLVCFVAVACMHQSCGCQQGGAEQQCAAKRAHHGSRGWAWRRGAAHRAQRREARLVPRYRIRASVVAVVSHVPPLRAPIRHRAAVHVIVSYSTCSPAAYFAAGQPVVPSLEASVTSESLLSSPIDVAEAFLSDPPSRASCSRIRACSMMTQKLI